MMRQILRITVLACAAAMAGCASFESIVPDYSTEQAIRDDVWSIQPAPTVKQSRADAQPATVVEAEVEPLYSFVASDLPIEKACKLFGKAYDLNIVVERDVVGSVSVDLSDLPFAEVMESLLGANGYYWQRRGNIVYIKSWETRSFDIDYIRLIRTGSSNSQAQVSSSTAIAGGAGGAAGAAGGIAAGGAGGDGMMAGAISIEQTDKVDFWDELESQLDELASDDGRLVVNRLSGTVQITDRHERVEEVAAYIEQVNAAIYRQVDIEVKIVEVTLNDDESLGVDWSRIVRNGDGEFVQGTLSTIVLSPAGGVVAQPPSADLTYANIQDGLNRVTAVIQALQQQGEVAVISQPHIRALNNQSALIKVGTDRTFFRKEQTSDATNAGTQTFSTDVPQVVTEGIVLSLTPQISSSGWITMDISPVVTRVSSVSEVLDDNGNVQSTAPNLDISQASSLIRARNGDTIVIGGLIQRQQTETRRRVPWLGRIPLIGRLFSSTYTTDVRKELIMLVTPRIINGR
ncbi:MAG: secretin N-terminal domain-containing protein [Pseudomonadota bacterium]